ncbi:MAG: Coenzyme F420 hydrogenase/dehydrogenase, beta subunit C-terminal domain [Clostridia bacterium]|nr:Coenzyme F420 hydrogenase/dehydrogenase, beta subunit C-terminal domain [Clostridia bacterium]
MAINNILSNITTDDCCGCGACVKACPTNAINYKENKYGFLYPCIVEDKCVGCGKCVKVCPIINVNLKQGIRAYSAVSKDDKVLENSSSGGIFSHIAAAVLKQQGYVFGCTMDEKFQVRHVCIHLERDLYQVTKSKYVQSFLGNIFNDVLDKLKENIKVLFCGTPCQVAAINNFIDDKYKENLLTIDVVCHGVPSQKLFNSYISFLENRRNKKLVEYTFRYKKNSHEGMLWYSSYRYEKGQRVTVNWPEDSYNYYYMKGATYRNSCYQCKYAQAQRAGDITLCDYWGYEKFHKEFTRKDSVSGIIVNSQKGLQEILALVPKLKIYETSISHLVENNGCLREPTKKDLSDGNILELWVEKGYEFVDKQFKTKHRKQRLKYKIMRHLPKKLIYLIRRK